MQYCIRCQQSLAGGFLTLPWQDGDNEDAYVELTARKRDGSGEAVYTVNFKKSYERWRISSGTMLDLIAPVE